MAYDHVHNAWQGERGGGNPEQAYQRCVEAGLTERPATPFLEAYHGWLLGGAEFVERIRCDMQEPRFSDEVSRSRQLSGLDVDMVLDVVADHYDVSTDLFSSHTKTQHHCAGKDPLGVRPCFLFPELINLTHGETLKD